MRTAKTQELSFMLEEIRQHHIDIEAIIQKEMDEILPQYIEEIITNVYNERVLCDN